MKKTLTLFVAVLMTAVISAQAPDRMSYQAVIRDASGNLITEQEIGMKISIIQGTVFGASVYIETQSPVTNENGLVTIAIGDGVVVHGTFSGIDWADGPYFIKTETDPSGGTTYTITGTSQLLSVPYALHARTTDQPGPQGETGPTGADGQDGADGADGSDGLSAYEVWLSLGNEGTEEEFIASLTGPEGPAGPAGAAGPAGPPGADGQDGANTLAELSDVDATLADTGKILKYDAMHDMWLIADDLGITSETDPVFGASPAAGIDAVNIANWTETYGWGDHALMGYVPETRMLSINGTTFNLSENRTWQVGTVTSAGLMMPDIFSVTGSPVTEAGTFSVDLVSQPAHTVFAAPVGESGLPLFRLLVPADIPALDWSLITTGKPTTLAGYGITNGVNTTGNQTIGGNKTFTGTTTFTGLTTFSNIINANGNRVANLADPINAQDAATKTYVDDILNKLSSIGAILADVDGNIYSTVRIGPQVWMAENLKTRRYNDGTFIPYMANNYNWYNLTTPAYCWYNNDITNKDTYGALYNWYAVNTGKLCPSGWHVPTFDEWETLRDYLIASGYNFDNTTVGNKIAKSLASASGWASSTIHGSPGNTDYPLKRNVTGFTALPGGYRRHVTGSFMLISGSGYWWSSSTGDFTPAWYYMINTNSQNISNGTEEFEAGFSVRCVRDN